MMQKKEQFLEGYRGGHVSIEVDSICLRGYDVKHGPTLRLSAGDAAQFVLPLKRNNLAEVYKPVYLYLFAQEKA